MTGKNTIPIEKKRTSRLAVVPALRRDDASGSCSQNPSSVDTADPVVGPIACVACHYTQDTGDRTESRSRTYGSTGALVLVCS